MSNFFLSRKNNKYWRKNMPTKRRDDSHQSLYCGIRGIFVIEDLPYDRPDFGALHHPVMVYYKYGLKMDGAAWYSVVFIVLMMVRYTIFCSPHSVPFSRDHDKDIFALDNCPLVDIFENLSPHSVC